MINIALPHTRSLYSNAITAFFLLFCTIIILLASLQFVLKMIVLVIMVAIVLFYRLQTNPMTSTTPTHLQFIDNAHDEWTCVYEDGDFHTLQLNTITSYGKLIVLEFIQHEQPYQLRLWQDVIDHNSWRQLQVLAKLSQTSQSPV